MGSIRSASSAWFKRPGEVCKWIYRCRIVKVETKDEPMKN